MIVIVGDGAHAQDIKATVDYGWDFDHHSKFQDWVRGNEIIIAINDPRLRAKIARELQVEDEPWVHPDAVIGHGSGWEHGTHVNYGVSMVRAAIGRHTTISPGVTICGGVNIGDEVLIGAGATVCDRVSVGSRATIGAGACVLSETVIPGGETWVGLPARKVEK